MSCTKINDFIIVFNDTKQNKIIEKIIFFLFYKKTKDVQHLIYIYWLINGVNFFVRKLILQFLIYFVQK